jgi:hypothetical protein
VRGACGVFRNPPVTRTPRGGRRLGLWTTEGGSVWGTCFTAEPWAGAGGEGLGEREREKGHDRFCAHTHTHTHTLTHTQHTHTQVLLSSTAHIAVS